MATWMNCFWIALWTCVTVTLAVAQQPTEGLPSSGAEVSATPSASTISVDPAVDGSSAKRSSGQPVSFWEEFLRNPLWLAIAMFLVMYLGVLLPARRSSQRQQREFQELVANLKKNDRVVTSFGVHGVVVSTQPDAGTVTIRLDESSNAKMTVNRDTIRVVKKD